jgi:hypothetical protein
MMDCSCNTENCSGVMWAIVAGLMYVVASVLMGLA